MIKLLTIKRFLSVLAVGAVLAFSGTLWWFAWLWPDDICTGPEHRAMLYRVDQDDWLVEWEPNFFLISTDDRIVVWPSHRDIRVGSLLLWPRDSLNGPVYGGMKADVGDFAFNGDEVKISYEYETIVVDVARGSIRCPGDEEDR